MGGSGTYVNGTSSTDDTTYYIYDNPGTYTVILTITDTNDCQHSDTNTVIVRPNPIANFNVTYTYDTLYCINTPITFTDILSTVISPLGGSLDEWEWDFGSGPNITTSNTINNIYNIPGSKTINMIVTDIYDLIGHNK